MSAAVASKFCKILKSGQPATLHSQTEICGDCGAPPYTPTIVLDDDDDAPTSSYVASAVSGGPHHPTTRVTSQTLVPNPTPIQHPQPRSLPAKPAAQPNNHRLKGKQSKPAVAKQFAANQEALQVAWLKNTAESALALIVSKLLADERDRDL
jgi:hypothetical protein